MRSKNPIFLLIFVLIAFTCCRTDFDIEEVAPSIHLESDEMEDHDHSDEEVCIDCESEDIEVTSLDDQVEESHAGHDHGTANRNHGTQWFFNQPWAASFIWVKLLRDAVIFLVLAVAVFLFSGKWKKR